jgi:hypothetical protein
MAIVRQTKMRSFMEQNLFRDWIATPDTSTGSRSLTLAASGTRISLTAETEKASGTAFPAVALRGEH